MKIRLDYETEPNKWGDRTDLVIYKDGVQFFRGSYGGEPEDNSHYRDYSWVSEAIAKVARELGAEVEHTSTDLKAEES
jgi:hypothetical protein